MAGLRAPEQPGNDARILIVDDSEDNRYTLLLSLELQGYHNVAEAEDGEQAMALIERNEYDLVLLDVMMPHLDGYQVLAWLKDTGRLHNLPVIMISALTETESVVRCIEIGAVDYLTKPFNPVLLRARTHASLEKKRLRDAVRSHLARLEADLDAARRLQFGMLPVDFPLPTRERPVEFAAMIAPAREVGGDLYDVFELGTGQICFLIGDVSGKGVPAALFMARTKNLVRVVTELMRGPDGAAAEPAEILARVNRELCDGNRETMFVTLFFAMLRPETGEIRFCNAGHNPPYRVAAGVVAPITGGKARPLGIRTDSPYVTANLTLAPDEMLYLYTDGITEACNGRDDLFSEARLEDVLRGGPHDGAAGLIRRVGEAVRAFVAGTDQSDDMAALVLYRRSGMD